MKHIERRVRQLTNDTQYFIWMDANAQQQQNHSTITLLYGSGQTNNLIVDET